MVRKWKRRFSTWMTASVVVGATTIAGSALGPSIAAAAVAPLLPATTSMASADALPTVQVDGVVWSQAVVGNTVYAGGRFNNARPAGAAPGTNLTPRSNLLAYDITTGNLITSFAPSLNGQVMGVAASPDGSRIYVTGDFNTVNGQARRRIAAFSTATGQLISSFAPSGPNSQGRAVVATNDTVYVGGGFAGAGSQARGNLAAYRASDGALLAWNPNADYTVWAIAISADGSSVFAGGSFRNVGGQPAYGLAKINASTGALQPWNATRTVYSAGPDAGITSLKVQNGFVYGTAWHFGQGGNLEGAFKASVGSGDVEWATDCHGDNYSVFLRDGVVYTVGHAHYCGNHGGGFPQYSTWKFQHTQAWTDTAGGEILNDVHGYTNWHTKAPGPSMIAWTPDLAIGSFTGQYQAGWDITGNADYIVVGGEFPRANGVPQQGLVRFARRPISPRAQGIRFNGNQFVPTVVPRSPTSARVSWLAGYDRDDLSLRYEVFRAGTAGPRFVTDVNSMWWMVPSIGFVDTGLTPGQTYTYRVVARDSDGNTVNSSSTSITMPSSVPTNAYADRVRADGARIYWPLNGQNATVVDRAGVDDGIAGAGVAWNQAGAVPGDAAARLTTTDQSSRIYQNGVQAYAPDVFSIQTWFRTGTGSGGRILGFSDLQTGNSGHRDRKIYMNNAGRLVFGVRSRDNQPRTITTARSYNDNQWHQVTATMSPAGMQLFVDGVRVGSRADTTVGENYLGHWRVGGDVIGSNWPTQPSNVNFVGDIDEVAIYPTALSAGQIEAQYELTGRGAVVPPVPADAYGAAVYADDPELYWRFGEASGTTANDSGRSGNPGTYRNGVVLGQAGVVAGNGAARFDGSNDFTSSNASFANPTTYSQEAWFRTSSTTGGKIIGFGNNQTGNSTSYDRHIYMQNDGKLVFGTYTGQTNTVVTPSAYNNGQWHHVVATQSSAGMKLYVDGQLVGTNPQTAAQNFTGYWKVGGDPTWGSTSAYLNAAIDEVAVYGYELPAARVLDHYGKGGGTVSNQPPTAAFTSTKSGLRVDVNGSGSSDADGTIASHSWNWGDGTPASTGATASHTYGAAGSYTITLTVTDDDGAVDTETASVTVTAPPVNQPPVAAFTATPNGLLVAVNGAASSDPDGTIASHSWNWGDGTPAATGAQATHSYAPGSYTITLTVTDNQGATDTETASVTVSETQQIALDTFTRTGTNGFGSADVGGAWSVTSATLLSVDGSGGLIRMNPGQGPSAYLNGVAGANVDAVVDLSSDKAGTGGGIYQSFVVRRVGTSDYRAKLRITATSTTLSLVRNLAGVETTLASQVVPGFVYQPGQVIHLRLRATGTGTTSLATALWVDAQPEPTTWNLTATDATPELQNPGGVGVNTYLSGSATNGPVTVRVDDLDVISA